MKKSSLLTVQCCVCSAVCGAGGGVHLWVGASCDALTRPHCAVSLAHTWTHTPQHGPRHGPRPAARPARRGTATHPAPRSDPTSTQRRAAQRGRGPPCPKSDTARRGVRRDGEALATP
eukprot:322987-Prymnesium_polylepis.1